MVERNSAQSPSCLFLMGLAELNLMSSGKVTVNRRETYHVHHRCIPCQRFDQASIAAVLIFLISRFEQQLYFLRSSPISSCGQRFRAQRTVFVLDDSALTRVRRDLRRAGTSLSPFGFALVTPFIGPAAGKHV